MLYIRMFYVIGIGVDICGKPSLQFSATTDCSIGVAGTRVIVVLE